MRALLVDEGCTQPPHERNQMVGARELPAFLLGRLSDHLHHRGFFEIFSLHTAGLDLLSPPGPLFRMALSDYMAEIFA